MSEAQPHRILAIIRRYRLDSFLMNSKRFMIVTILYALGPQTMGELRSMLGLTWGDIDSKLRSLEERGYVRMRKIFTLAGPRTLIELTERGAREYEELCEKLRSILESADDGRERLNSIRGSSTVPTGSGCRQRE